MENIHTYAYRLPFTFKGRDLGIDFTVVSGNSEAELTLEEIRNTLFRLIARANDMELTENIVTSKGMLDIWLPANQIRELLIKRIDYLVDNDLMNSYLEKIEVIDADELDETDNNGLML